MLEVGLVMWLLYITIFGFRYLESLNKELEELSKQNNELKVSQGLINAHMKKFEIVVDTQLKHNTSVNRLFVEYGDAIPHDMLLDYWNVQKTFLNDLNKSELITIEYENS